MRKVLNTSLRSQGSSPSALSGWNTSPSGQSDLLARPPVQVQYLSHCAESGNRKASSDSFV